MYLDDTKITARINSVILIESEILIWNAPSFMFVCVCAFLGIQSPRIGLILGRGLYSIIFSLSAFLGQLLYILTFYFNIFV